MEQPLLFFCRFIICIACFLYPESIYLEECYDLLFLGLGRSLGKIRFSTAPSMESLIHGLHQGPYIPILLPQAPGIAAILTSGENRTLSSAGLHHGSSQTAHAVRIQPLSKKEAVSPVSVLLRYGSTVCGLQSPPAGLQGLVLIIEPLHISGRLSLFG